MPDTNTKSAPSIELNADGTFKGGVPDKFVGKTPADLVAAYASLERSKSAQLPPNDLADGLTIPVPTPADNAQAWYSEIETTGKLSEASYSSAVAKHGKVVVDGVLAGAHARGRLTELQVHSAAGGKDQFTALLKWAGTNLDRQDAQAFNDAVRAGGSLAQLAVQGLMARHVASGNSPLIQGSGPGGSSRAQPYASVAQWKVDMAGDNAKKYETDPAHRALVAQRHAASVAAGVEGF